MLLVPTFLATSPLHGVGLFAQEYVAEGKRIWEFTPGFDLELSAEQLQRLAEACRQRLLAYAYYNATKVRYIRCSDDARLINHSDRPNTHDVGFGGQVEGITLAARNIAAGEEITSDYRAFDQSGDILIPQPLPIPPGKPEHSIR